jgi:hypothetical protein
VPQRLVAVLAAVIVVAVVAAGAGWWFLGRGPTGPLADAFRTLPADGLRLGFTDWARVSGALDAPRGDDALDDERLSEFLGKAYDADVTTTSAVVESFAGLAANYGITPADAEWEAYGQGRAGAVDVLRLRDGVDLDAIEDRLATAGYQEPDDEDGVWVGSGDLVATLDEPLTTTQKNVAIVHDQRLLMMADDTTYLEQAIPAATGEEDSVMEQDGVSELVDAVGDPRSAQVWVGDFACEDLAMSKADQVEQQEGDRLTEEAGGVHPLDGMALARGAGTDATVALWFSSDAQAEDDLQPRTDLARGAAPGQGGTFAERYDVVRAVQDGRLVRLDLKARSDTVMSDLGQGSVLFATC